ncbi:MAG: hypothetical protein ABI361_05175 [Nitrososphaera sp.]|jgi:hypothetical protein
MPISDQNQISQHTSAESEASGSIFESSLPSRVFVMCENCYWSASLLQTKALSSDFLPRIDLSSCPACKASQPLSTLPIADNEVFEFSYSERHGVELDFMPCR